MNRQIQQIIIFSILALLSYTIWSYYFDREESIQEKPFTKGYSIGNLELRVTDESGNLTAKFKSPSLIRYTDSPVVFMQTPLLWTFKQGKEHWLIKSNKAEYNANLDEVVLYDNLIAKTINDESETIFKANNILLNLNSNQAYTKDGIILKQKQEFTMTGQIATFDLKNEILEVNNNVKAIYKTKK
ncbi:MAG: LPS export ABC transporter periplasmic protein LptC [Alcanivoracaceae bacterium]|nr:LPS export ABC transporter periplasmic protein LptC [Alcanivoracaceae bacterium]